MLRLRRALSRTRWQLRALLRHRALEPATLVFRCNVCGTHNALPMAALQRETGLCLDCRANVRFRAMVHHLSQALFGESLPIGQFPAKAAQLVGIGMSDAHIYAERLAARMRYTNTFYDREPRLDICAPGEAYLSACDFVLSSDVLEHVAPPVQVAFDNLRRVLKPGGLLVLTVPFVLEGRTVEHFPDLHDWSIERRGETPVLLNNTADGRRQEFGNLVFHGGEGATLEMRRFSEADLRANLQNAGFDDIRFHREPCFASGIYWHGAWSVPVTARAA